MTVLDEVAGSSLASEAVFGGGAALAARHLHHRRSEDVDFFFTREVTAGEVRPLARALVRGGMQIIEELVVGPRRSLLRAKFDAGADRLTLAQKLGRAVEIVDLPAMLRPLTRDELARFFVERARELVRQG